MEVKIKKLHEDAIIPSYAHETDAGFDLCTYEEVTIGPGERASVPTGLAIVVPKDYVGLIWDKSGISQNEGIKTLGGVLDHGYTGEVMVGLLNTGRESYTFSKGHKMAQMLIQRVEHAELTLVDTLEETERGTGSHGSTGK